jgi:hypothetical protein
MTSLIQTGTLIEEANEQRHLDEETTTTKESKMTAKTTTAKGWRITRLTAAGKPSKNTSDTIVKSTKKAAKEFAKNKGTKWSWLLENLAKPDSKPETISFQAPAKPETKAPAKTTKKTKAPKKTVPTVIALLRSNGMTSKSGRNARVVGRYPKELGGKAFFDNHGFGDEGDYNFVEFKIHEGSRNCRVIRDIKPATPEAVATWLLESLSEETNLSKKALATMLK